MTPEELAIAHGVADWNAYFDDLAEWAAGKPVFFEGTSNWVTPPSPAEDVSIDFLCINRDGRITKGKLIDVSTQEGRLIHQKLEKMIEHTEDAS